MDKTIDLLVLKLVFLVIRNLGDSLESSTVTEDHKHEPAQINPRNVLKKHCIKWRKRNSGMEQVLISGSING